MYLQNLCRVCGNRIKTYKHNKIKEVCKGALSKLFDIAVEEEDEFVSPPFVCHCCYLTLSQVLNAKESGQFRETDLTPKVWAPHTDTCQICENAQIIQRGRPKKRKAKGRPSVDDCHYQGRKIVHRLSHLNIHKYVDCEPPLQYFLTTPHLDHFSCQICHSIPTEPIQLLGCQHLMCTSCIRNQCENEAIICSCGNPVYAESICLPSNFVVPSPLSITVEQLLELQSKNSPSQLRAQTVGLLVEKLAPSNGSLTCRSSLGQVSVKFNRKLE